MNKFTMGIDFGTLSVRAVIADISNGKILCEAISEYEHGVMTDSLLNKIPLPKDWALQHPMDYLNSLYEVTNKCLKNSNISAEDVVGVGVDFTASTIMPVTEDGTPLCFLDEFKENPHAYVKLWKHHSAQKEADDINTVASKMYPQMLKRYGGAISGEWMFPKILQILREDENLYNKTFRFVEAGDWIVWQLTGKENHSVCQAGFKALWSEKDGYPGKEFFKALDSRMENIIGTKVCEKITKMSDCAGMVSQSAHEKTGLFTGTRVAPCFIDAHAALPAAKITGDGELLMILGTSSCFILNGAEELCIPGISGYVKDGITDGYYAYEAGQACVGDCFDWFVKNCVPHSYYCEAEEKGCGIHKLLREKAKKLSPGSNGLLALDWWNGNRTPYDDSSLSGMILGMTLSTKPEELYRALIESTAYGARRIIEIYEENGIKLKTLCATGGIAEKDELFMQIYSDVLGREIYLADASQGCALGSAILGAVNCENGYPDLTSASEHMGKIKDAYYKPNLSNKTVYDDLYEEYKNLSEYFSKASTMKKIRK